MHNSARQVSSVSNNCIRRVVNHRKSHNPHDIEIDLIDLNRRASRLHTLLTNDTKGIVMESLRRLTQLTHESQIDLVSMISRLSTFERDLPECKTAVGSGLKYSGYQSVVDFYHTGIRKTIDHLKACSELTSRRIFFGHPLSSTWTKQLVAWEKLLRLLVDTIKLSNILLRNSSSQNLFIQISAMTDDEKRVLFKHFTPSSVPFGRTLSFQFDESLFYLMNAGAVLMAAFADSRYQQNVIRHLATAINSPKYILDPELKAERVAQVLRELDIDLCKSFWELTDSDAFIVSSRLSASRDLSSTLETKINRKLIIHCTDRMKQMFEKTDQQLDRVNIRFLAANSELDSPASRILFLQIHGGGYVAMSSRSHQLYLSHWVNKFNIPVICVDYGLSPEYYYPRALNECLAAYVHIIENANKFGWTGEKIVVMGDSAGGNLSTALAFKLERLGILKRIDHLILFYPTLSLIPTVSPSRLLSMFDLVLNGNVALHFALAYMGVRSVPKNDQEPGMAKDVVEHLERFQEQLSNPLVSPLCASEQDLAKLPPLDIFVSKCDPMLDDSITLAQRLGHAHIGINVHLVDGVPHGFLNMFTASKLCTKVYNECTNTIGNLIKSILE